MRQETFEALLTGPEHPALLRSLAARPQDAVSAVAWAPPPDLRGTFPAREEALGRPSEMRHDRFEIVDALHVACALVGEQRPATSHAALDLEHLATVGVDEDRLDRLRAAHTERTTRRAAP